MITKAALLMQNRKSVKISKIAVIKNKRGHKMYLIQLINTKHKMMRTVVMNPASGHIRPVKNNKTLMMRLTPAKNEI